jgi:hypothetical protein
MSMLSGEMRERGHSIRHLVQNIVPIPLSRVMNKQVDANIISRMVDMYSLVEINWGFGEDGIIERGLFQEGFKVS